MRTLNLSLIFAFTACTEVSISETEREGDDPGECSDAADNDRNNLFDCDDPGCAGSPDCDTGAEDSDSDPVIDSDSEDSEPVDSEPEDSEPEDSASEPQWTFADPGEHSFVVPSGTTTIHVDLWGGGGAGGNQIGAAGGGGAYVRGSFAVTPGETLTIRVAEGGVQPGNGGGATYLLRGTDLLAVAAGGGGGGSDGCSGCKAGGRGGAGGADAGEAGYDLATLLAPYCTSATGGAGGTMSAGGAGGTASGSAETVCNGTPGSQDTGGVARGNFGSCVTTGGATGWQQGGGQGNGGGGGGGAGYYGGGAAGFIWTYCAGGGGGGSSFVHSSATSPQRIGGSAQAAGNATAAGGAGAGGDVLANGANGLVQIAD